MTLTRYACLCGAQSEGHRHPSPVLVVWSIYVSLGNAGDGAVSHGFSNYRGRDDGLGAAMSLAAARDAGKAPRPEVSEDTRLAAQVAYAVALQWRQLEAGDRAITEIAVSADTCRLIAAVADSIADTILQTALQRSMGVGR